MSKNNEIDELQYLEYPHCTFSNSVILDYAYLNSVFYLYV